jgi:hypothetical protein
MLMEGKMVVGRTSIWGIGWERRHCESRFLSSLRYLVRVDRREGGIA